MDLLIFAAGVGYKKNRRVPVASAGKAVPYRIFENNQKEGYIFLLALAEKKEASALLQDNDDEAARVFEEYAAGGLDEISSWLATNPLDTAGIQSLISGIQGEIGIKSPQNINPSPL